MNKHLVPKQAKILKKQLSLGQTRRMPSVWGEPGEFTSHGEGALRKPPRKKLGQICARSALVLGLMMLILCSSVSIFVGCKEEIKKQIYFNDLVIPIGVGQITVVSDVSMNPPTGGEINVTVTVEPELDRDELNRLMTSFFRQARDRRGFQRPGKPEKIDLRFYVSEALSKGGGDNWLARVLTTNAEAEPMMTNNQKAPLLKWVKKVLGKQQEYTGDLKPRILADATAMAVEVTVPFVDHGGEGKYVKELTYVRATTEFVSYAMSLFEKIPQLNKLTFIGKHNDLEAVNIWLSRDQYIGLDLRKVEEGLGAFDGQFIELLMSKQISEKAFINKKRKQRHKVYSEALGRLPAGQVMIIKGLR